MDVFLKGEHSQYLSPELTLKPGLNAGIPDELWEKVTKLNWAQHLVKNDHIRMEVSKPSIPEPESEVKEPVKEEEKPKRIAKKQAENDL